MSTININASTINISSQGISGECKLKCAYSFNYQNSSLIATNNGFSINLSYDKANTPPVIYNANKYEVDGIMICSPSIHLFNGSKADAEIIIKHRPVVAGESLSVAIPILSAPDSNKASELLTQIINAVSANAPAQGEKTNINISNFNLNTFVPAKKPLYSYIQNKTNWIIFGKENSISLNKNILATLKKIIKPLPTNEAPAGPDLFLNPDGALQGLSGNKDQIYIDCKPVTSSKEKIDVVENKMSTSFDLNNPTTFLILQIIISFALFFVLLFVVQRGLKYVSKASLSVPKIAKLS